MAPKSGDQRSGQDRRGPQRTGPAVSRRRIKRDDDSSQILEPGEGPTAEEAVNPAGEGGFSTLGGGVYPDEGSPDDENTWGKERSTAERQEEQGRRRADKGPRAQRRSDESLAQEIREILTHDPELDATEIEVEVEGGAVTISGLVEGSDAKLLAEEMVESVTGVREVHNRLRVER